MTTAWNNLYEPDIASLPVTNLYVRFLPDSEQELFDLQALDLILYDFPIDYEVVTAGAFYHDPSIPEGEITWQYAVVDPDFDFPAIEHEILSNLVLAPYYSALTVEAFKLTGNDWKDPLTGEVRTPCTPGCPNWPDCDFDPGIPCDSGLEDPPPYTPPGTDPPCAPFLPDGISQNEAWPDCLMVETPPGTWTQADPPINDCGCYVSTNPFKPGGCVRVLDTQLGLEGVRNVQVIVKGDWFQQASTWTNATGCYFIDELFLGDMSMWVKFKSDRVTIRGATTYDILGYSSAVKDNRGKMTGPGFNNINIEYLPENDDESVEKMYWYAATFNNSVYEFDEFALQDGIASPPDDLTFLLTNFNTPGAATPMLDKLNNNPIVTLGLLGVVPVMATLFPTVAPLPPVFVALLWNYVITFLPDIVDGYGGREDWPSDWVKNIYYHELAHSAHYNELNNDNYWLENVVYIIGQGGYGDGTQPGAERTAIIEMWGEYIGDTYTDRQYGIDHSLADNIASPTTQQIEARRWIYEAELAPIIPQGDPDGWIPWGLVYDLVDDNSTNPTSPAVNDPAGTSDMVGGFATVDILAAISIGLELTVEVRNELIQNFLPTGQSAVGVITLFNVYDW